VRLRRALLDRLPRQPALAAVEADPFHLLSSWFNPGFLEMRRRLQPDRRCFAFFHPQLQGEPLIFVEVALAPEMAGAIAPLIDKRAQPLPPEQFKVAVFYSISNCQPELLDACGGDFAALTHSTRLMSLSGEAHHALWRLAAHYLVKVSTLPHGDPVARFHLDNGARAERLNAQADLSPKGLNQSAGLMVNYLYDLARIEGHHDRFVHGEAVASRAISALL
jgi:malonyl-CoA decarboxylase